jgi:hypothetical protein
MIINLHRLNTNNIGDLACTPVHYFDELTAIPEFDSLGYLQSETPDQQVRSDWVAKVSSADVIIVGGGGLLGIDFFAPALKKMFSEKKSSAKTVLWGAGHNSWQIGDWRNLKYKVDLSQLPFDSVGIRDFNQGFEWVPCVSCLSPLFDQAASAQITREIGLYVHEGTLKNESFKKRLPANMEVLSNDASLEKVIRYLSSCSVVLTDSYHGMYWSNLLGKKVVAFPSSSKFYDSKHPVPLCAPEDWQHHAQLARAYPEALEECRLANRRFADRFFDDAAKYM